MPCQPYILSGSFLPLLKVSYQEDQGGRVVAAPWQDGGTKSGTVAAPWQSGGSKSGTMAAPWQAGGSKSGKGGSGMASAEQPKHVPPLISLY